MNTALVCSAISIVLYVLYFVGIVLIEYDTVSLILKRLRLRRRLAVSEEKSAVSIYCSNLLTAAFGKDIDGIWLIALSCLIFAVTFVVSIRNYKASVAILMSIFCALLPFLFLYSKMQSMRNKGSKEGIAVISELYRQYKINNLNMLKAIELTLSAKADFTVCRKHFYVLLLRLQDAAGIADIRQSCKTLAFALGSNWGRSVAACVEISAVNGSDVSLALLDVLEQLKTAKKIAEERKRLNSESMRMTLFLVPFMYMLTVLASVKYVGISFSKFLSNQFMTQKGLLLFIINIVLFIMNAALVNIVDGMGMDY